MRHVTYKIQRTYLETRAIPDNADPEHFNDFHAGDFVSEELIEIDPIEITENIEAPSDVLSMKQKVELLNTRNYEEGSCVLSPDEKSIACVNMDYEARFISNEEIQDFRSNFGEDEDNE